MELLKVRLQLQTAVRGQPGYVGPLRLLRSIWHAEGLRGGPGCPRASDVLVVVVLPPLLLLLLPF